MLIDYLSDRRSVVDNKRFYVRDRSVVLVLLEKRRLNHIVIFEDQLLDGGSHNLGPMPV